MKAKERIKVLEKEIYDWREATGEYIPENARIEIEHLKESVESKREMVERLKKELAEYQPKTEWRITDCNGNDVTVFAHKYKVPALFYNNDGTVAANFKEIVSVINVTQEKENE